MKYSNDIYAQAFTSELMILMRLKDVNERGFLKENGKFGQDHKRQKYKILVSFRNGYFNALCNFNKEILHAVLEYILGETSKISDSAMKTFLRYTAEAENVDLFTILRTVSAMIRIVLEKADQRINYPSIRNAIDEAKRNKTSLLLLVGTQMKL